VLVFLLLAGIGAVTAILIAGNGNGGSFVAVPTDTGQVTSPTPPPTQTIPTVTQPPPTTTAPPKPKPHPSNQLTSWPSRDGYTVILQSIPAGASRANAVGTARQALAAGLPQVGVLDSGRYSSLHPGYYVVFSGVYPSNTAASAHIAEAQRAGFRAAYVRPITH
jgi:septal ring-binding cell division protein DamX